MGPLLGTSAPGRPGALSSGLLSPDLQSEGAWSEQEFLWALGRHSVPALGSRWSTGTHVELRVQFQGYLLTHVRKIGSAEKVFEDDCLLSFEISILDYMRETVTSLVGGSRFHSWGALASSRKRAA